MNKEDLLKHRINAILADHERRMDKIRREETRQAWRLCPIISAMFMVMAAYLYIWRDIVIARLCGLAALAFIAIPLLKAIFERPKRRRYH